MTLDKALQILIGNQEDDKAEKFLHFLSDKLWELYNIYVMDKMKMADGELKWNLNIPNAKENIEYNQTVIMPQVNSDIFDNVELELVDAKGLDEDKHGLKLTVAPDGKSLAITGIPSLEAFRKDGAVAESTFELTLIYKFCGGIEMPEDRPTLEHKMPFVINQDPRKLWRNLPVDWENMPEPKYKNDDTQVEYVKVEALVDGTPQKDIVAASKRGRSHAQEGKPRDDHFRMEHMDNGWYIMAVADGAGSAKYSRQGSTIACDEAVSHCMSKLGQSKAFEDSISGYGNLQDSSDEEAVEQLGLKNMPDKFKITEQVDLKDYLYDGNAMRTLSGKKLHKKKNHLNAFKREYEGRYEYRRLCCSDRGDVWKFLDRWREEKGEEVEEHLDYEVRGIHEILKNCSLLNVRMSGVYIDGHLEAFTIGSYNPLEQMAVIHIEKANPEIRGLYQFINQQFLIEEFPEAVLINREDDLGLEGLRKAKLSYNPIDYARKYQVEQIW